MAKVQTSALALMVDTRKSGEYLHVNATVVELAQDGSPRNLRPDDAYSDHREYAGIGASAQADADSGDSPAYSYAWRFGIRLDSYDTMPTANVALVARTLAQAERRIAAIDAAAGPARSFGSYIARIASALRMPVVMGVSGEFGTYATGQWNVWAPGDAANVIDGRIAAHRAPKVVA